MKRDVETPIKLIVNDGLLGTRGDDISDEVTHKYYGSDDFHLLLATYGEDDHKTIKYPKVNVEHLRSALYDARETGFIPNHPVVLLPDGKEFNIDA